MDESPDVSEITLEDFTADEAPKEPQVPKAATDPSPVKDDNPKAAEAKVTEEETKADDTAVPDKEPEAKETEDSKSPEDPKVEETKDPPSKADERKSQLNTEIRDLVAQRNVLREQVEKANSEVYQVATESELVDGGMSEIEAKVEQMRQEREMERYNTQVAEAQLTLGHEANRVIQDFPIFNPEHEQYDKELATSAAALMEKNLIIDQNTNQIIGSNVSPYELYQTLAQATGISAVKGQMKGQADTQAMLANTDSASTASPPKETVDPLIKLWRED